MNQKFETVIIRMNDIVQEYYRMDDLDGHILNGMLKDLSAGLYYLETVRSEVHNEFQSEIQRLVSEGHSVSRAENQAHVRYPAMYKLRRIMDGGYKVVEAIRSNLSYLKHEITTSKSAT